MSSTNSQNFPRTFFKLTSSWDRKAMLRNSTQNIWSNHGVSSKEPMLYIPCVMSGLFEEHSDNMARCLSEVRPADTREVGNQVWIYNMRASDSVPRTIQDERKLYLFVRTMLKSWCDCKTFNYIEKNIHICVCFFVWYFTKQEFFYSDKVIRQTTRKGIQRVWTCVLLRKEPVSSPARILTQTQQRNLPSITTDALLPKQQQQQEKLKKDIQRMFSSTTLAHTSLDWEDSRILHVKLSECMTNSNSGLSINQNKKLQKMYNEYTTLSTKINKSFGKIRKVERANAKIVPQTQAAAAGWIDEFGPPPPIAVLRRHDAAEDYGEFVDDAALTTVAPPTCWGVIPVSPINRRTWVVVYRMILMGMMSRIRGKTSKTQRKMR